MQRVDVERLIYLSRALSPEPAAALDDILQSSIWNNARLRITGALGFSGQTYVQFLEGPAESLDELLVRLKADPRHRDLTVLVRCSAENRMLPGWTMARVDLAEHAPKVNHLLASGDGLALIGLMVNLVRKGVTGVI